MKWSDLCSYASRLRQCTATKNRMEGMRLHSLLSESNHDRHTFIGNLLVNMYGDCGLVHNAWEAFERTQEKNAFSWNIIIAAYAHNGEIHLAREMFERMPQTNVVTWNSVISAYARNRELRKLRELFRRMPERNVCSWNANLAAYAQLGHLHEVCNTFSKMPCVQVVSWNSLITAYGDKGCVEEARIAFDNMRERNPSSWNAMLAAYASSGHIQDANGMLDLMPEQTLVSWNALITVFCTFGRLQEARNLFENVPVRNVITWSTLITGYAQNAQGEEALQLFREMDIEGTTPDNIAFISVIYACATIPALAVGRIIHRLIDENGLPQDVPLGNNLINMYAKCGNLVFAREVFDNMAVRDIMAWNTMITAYTHAGLHNATFDLYHIMMLRGIEPVHVTFVSVLSSCSHAGLLKNARQHFHSMIQDFGMVPGFEHYRCMIDVLGRIGQLERAEDLIESMPYKPDGVIWNTLLGACKNHNDLDRAARVGQYVFKTDPNVRSSYILLSTTLMNP